MKLPKQEMRKEYLRKRKEFAANGSDVNRHLADHLVPFLSQCSGTWATYKEVRSEANISVAMSESSHIRWAYPCVTGEAMGFRVPNKEGQWTTNEWGIKEPSLSESELVEVSELDGVLVPGIAFDREGRRLGSGKGYYDRALESYRGTKVGIAYSVQISQQPLPSDDHDISMDLIVTEQGVIPVNERN